MTVLLAAGTAMTFKQFGSPVSLQCGKRAWSTDRGLQGKSSPPALVGDYRRKRLFTDINYLTP
jgi:hypothetical protein